MGGDAGAGRVASAGWWSSFVSRGTLISGVLSILFWGLTLGWVAGGILVVLLYIHELGHLLVARARHRTIHGAPIFLPGLGAFVRIEPSTNVWDDVFVVFGGPVIGGAIALLAGVAGVLWHFPTLIYAGSFGLFFNLANLLPLMPLDGGRLAARTGWLGFIPTLLAGGAVLLWTVGGHGSPLLGLIAGVGLYWGYHSMRAGQAEPWPTQLRITLGHVFACLVLAASLRGLNEARSRMVFTASSIAHDRLYRPFAERTGQVAWLTDSPRVIEWLLLAVAFLIGLSTLAWRLAFRPSCNRTLRYTLLALVCWPSLLLGDRTLIPGMWCLLAQRCGLPGLRWLARYIRWLAAQQHPAAGLLCAYAYDAQRPTAAEAWLVSMEPTIRVAGGRAIVATSNTLQLLDHSGRAYRLVVGLLEGTPPTSLTAPAANSLAYSLLKVGRPAAGLPYARAAVATERQPWLLGTLGEILHELDQQAEAEELLRESLALRESYVDRLALARVCAAQQRHAEAVATADHALLAHQGPWAIHEPQKEEVRGWMNRWLAAAAIHDEDHAPQAADKANEEQPDLLRR